MIPTTVINDTTNLLNEAMDQLKNISLQDSNNCSRTDSDYLSPNQLDEVISFLDQLTLTPDKSIVIIQKHWRGYIVRKRSLPIILQLVRMLLLKTNVTMTQSFKDGRMNSSVDEIHIIQTIQSRYPDRINIPSARMWYDILLLDHIYGWIPVNIKVTTLASSDNTGNLAMCAYAYTNIGINLHTLYRSGELQTQLSACLKAKQYNLSYKRDYFFLVINKRVGSDIVISSVRGLTKLTNNVNNLPFQIKWSNNRNFVAKPIQESVRQFIECIQKNKPSWKEVFVASINTIEITQ